MTSIGRKLTTGLGLMALLTSVSSSAWAIAPLGAFGAGAGESRGITSFTGRAICIQCTIDDVHAAQPALSGLYQMRHANTNMVMQFGAPNWPLAGSVEGFTDSSEARRWKSIVGLGQSVSVRGPNAIMQQLLAEENLLKQVEIAGVLRPSRVYDVISINYLDPTPDPLAFSRQAQEAARRAEAAAARAEAAARRAADATVRAESAADRLAAMSDMAEQQFTSNLKK